MLDQRLRLLLVHLEALVDHFFLVVRALIELSAVAGTRRDAIQRMHAVDRAAFRADPATGQALYQRFATDIEQQHRFERLIDLDQQCIQGIRLVLVAGKPIEDETLRRIRTAQSVANQSKHDFVRHQLARFHHGLGLQAQFRTASNRVTQQVARRHLGSAMLRLQALRLCAFARPGRSQQDDTHDFELTSQKEALPYRKTGLLATGCWLLGRD